MSTGKLITILSFSGALVIAVACFFIFRSGKPDDPIKAQLDAAKSTHTQAIAAANTALVAAFDAEAKTLQTSGNADGATAVTSQKTAFTTSDTLPQTPYMKDAVTQYQQASKAADDALVAAYNDAIAGFDAESKSDLADAARGERTDLVNKIASSNTAGPAAPASTIAQELDAAKAANKQAIADARKILVTTVDDRLNAATDAGDLATVQALQAVKTAAQTDGSVSDDVKDPAIVAAKKRYDQAVVAANAVLVQAYQKAVRDYTKARQIDQAMATQKELTDLGIDRPAAQASTLTSASVPVVQFISAKYGDGMRMIDVSGRIAELYKTNSIILISDLPDPAPGIHKKLTAVFKIGPINVLLSGLQDETISIAASANPKGVSSIFINDHVKLNSAIYGVDRRVVDVTEAVASRLKSAQPVPSFQDSLGISDPASGVTKSLMVKLEVDGKPFDLSVQEGGEIRLDGSDSATAVGANNHAHPSDAIGFGGHWYRWFNTPMTWEAAENKCVEMGGHLVCVDSQAKEDFVWELAQHSNCWLGAIRGDKPGEWKWVDSSKFGFTYWAKGQPDNAGGVQNALLLWTGDGHWDDVASNGERYSFVCEWSN